MSGGVCEEIIKRSSDLVSRKIEHWRVARAVQILSINIRSFYRKRWVNSDRATTCCSTKPKLNMIASRVGVGGAVELLIPQDSLTFCYLERFLCRNKEHCKDSY